MARNETPDAIARTRTVNAESVLAGQIDLRAYPYRNLAISCQTGIGPERISYAIAAAESLDRYGWELVSLSEFGSGRLVYALMRRR